MTNCKLSNASARKAVATVWKHLRSHFPDEARLLGGIVREIVPLTARESEDGTAGQWFLTPLVSREEEIAFRARFGCEHGMGYGLLKLLDCDGLSVGIVAHELGHAFTSDDDLAYCGGPDEWASEAAADRHAVRWGLLTREQIHQRHMDSVADDDHYWTVHHGPPPGDGWFEIDGVRWRLREDFVFEGVAP